MEASSTGAGSAAAAAGCGGIGRRTFERLEKENAEYRRIAAALERLR
jgi:hypothetical protein